MQTNPLIQVVFDCLLEKHCWKIHTLANFLSQNGYLKKLDDDYNKDLFKKNFIIMNALFQLNDDLINSGYTLIIETLEIRLVEANKSNISKIIQNLKDYYLNWQYFETRGEDIETLLTSFWQTYSSLNITHTSDEISKALQYFELPKDATSIQISKRWKTLALKYHPDKHQGDKNKFQQLQAHWQILKTTLN